MVVEVAVLQVAEAQKRIGAAGVDLHRLAQVINRRLGILPAAQLQLPQSHQFGVGNSPSECLQAA